MYMIHTSPYSVLFSASSFDFGGFSSEDWVLKDELIDWMPASVSPVAVTDCPLGAPVVGVVASFDSNEELAELTRASRVSRSARRMSVNFSYAAMTPSLSPLASSASAYAKLSKKLRLIHISANGFENIEH